MTDQQLYLTIGVPILANFTMMLLGFTLLNSRIGDLRSEMNSRFDALEKLFDAKLARVEEVLDSRLRHLEER